MATQRATRQPELHRVAPRLRHAARLAFPALLLLAGSAAAQQQKKVLTLEDYPRWSRVTEVALSPDGRWMTYAYTPNEGDATFHVRELDGDRIHTTKNGGSPAFSPDSRWVAYLVSPPEAEQRKLRRERKPIPRTLELRDLRSGAKYTAADAQEFRFSSDSRFLAIHKRQSDADAKHQGRDLIVRDLASGRDRNIGNVAEFAFNEAGTLLAYTVDAAGKAGNGVYVLELATGVTTPLDTDTLRYAALAWNEQGTAVAVLRGEVPQGKERRANALLVFSGLGAAKAAERTEQGAVGASARSGPWSLGTSSAAETTVVGGATSSTALSGATSVTAVTYDPAADPDFPDGMVLSELGRLEWSEDGTRLFVGVKEQADKVERERGGDEEPRANVDIWHWADERVQSQQMVQANADRRFTYSGVVHLAEQRFVRLADEAMPRTEPTRDGRWALGQRDKPYRLVFDEPGGLRDIVRVDVATGERVTLAERVRYPLGASPDGRWHLYFTQGRLWAQEIATLERHDVSARAGVSFLNEEADRPGEKPSYGIAGWSKDGSAVLVNARYDVWLVPLRGGDAVNLTRGVGEREQIRFRVVRLDRDEPGTGRDRPAPDEGIDTSAPILLSAYGEWTKKSGYWIVEPGKEPRPLIWQDRMIRNLRKAKDADRVIFTSETFEEFPDWYVSGLDFEKPRRVTDANPQQKEYAWGRRVLIDYTDARGNKLQATLTLPAGYREGQKYPMIVYFYEKMSQRHHEYSMPVYDDRPHMSTYASDGYLVLMPDIVYDIGKPGSSALDDVTSAVRRVIELGYADPERIGLQGHSWGGYQSSFIVTQTDMFAAVVTGAPLTNLESMHNILYKSTGGPNAPLIQWGQGRMGTTPWEDPEGYASQSPIRHVANIRTPFLILHGTADGAVDWNQGLEFYIAARRAGKQVILLSYPDEPHHLSRKENQKDFQRRMKEYFDHYLKGKPAPEWMVRGVDYLEKERSGGAKE